MLDYGEFAAVSFHLLKLENDGHLRKAFTFFDQDGSGFIEFDELRKALTSGSAPVDDKTLGDILREVDTDKVRSSLHPIFFYDLNTPLRSFVSWLTLPAWSTATWRMQERPPGQFSLKTPTLLISEHESHISRPICPILLIIEDEPHILVGPLRNIRVPYCGL